jgi:hypothetical protein
MEQGYGRVSGQEALDTTLFFAFLPSREKKAFLDVEARGYVGIRKALSKRPSGPDSIGIHGRGISTALSWDVLVRSEGVGV